MADEVVDPAREVPEWVQDQLAQDRQRREGTRLAPALGAAVPAPPPRPQQVVQGDVAEIIAEARTVGATGAEVMALRGVAAMPAVTGLPALQDAVTAFSRAWIVALGEAGNGLVTIGRYATNRGAALRAAGS